MYIRTNNEKHVPRAVPYQPSITISLRSTFQRLLSSISELATSENMSSSNDHSPSNNDEENDGGLGGWARTKRAQQLQDLHSLVLNQIETDERSILEGARDYLQRILEETEQIERELPEKYASSSESQGPQILGVETEELTEGRFIIKTSWRKGSRGVGHVQRVIEGLDVKITSVFVHENIPDEMLTTAYVEVNKEMGMTEEELQHLVISAARRSGLFP